MERRFPLLRTVKKRTPALSIRIASPRTTRGLIRTILYAEPANTTDIGQALLKTCKPAILGTGAVAILRAPWIILGFGAISKANDSDANSQREQQEPHGSLMASSSVALSYKFPLFTFYSMLTRDQARRTASNIAKLQTKALYKTQKRSCILPSHAKFTHYATRSDGNSEGSSVRISFTDSAPVSTGKLTMDEKQTQHFGQSQT